VTHYPLILAQQRVPEVYFGNASHSSTVTGTFSFASMDFNVDNPNRLVIVAVHWYEFDTTADITSITVGGVTPTFVARGVRLVSGGTGSYIYAALYYVQPTGTSGTIALQFNRALDVGCSVATWSAYNLASNTPATSDAGNPARSVTTQPGDVVVAAATVVNPGNPATWTGATEDYDTQLAGLGRTGASAVTQNSGTLSVDATASGSPVTMAVAVWR